ncbi:MAG: hypothetical protein HFE81_06615 [Bacilli bacterium]|nr:hypothetical protein [Bacilli bacterium]
MSDQSAEIGMFVMGDILNGNTKNRDLLEKKDEEVRAAQLATRIAEQKIRKSKIPEWVKIALDVIDRELLDKYKEILSSFVLDGPGTGELMDLSMAVLTTLKESTMGEAAEILSSVSDEWDRFYIQNMAFIFSNKGPDFATLTLNRDLTPEENLKFSIKRMEIQRRENEKIVDKFRKGVNQ